MVKKGEFRQDLYYRINVIELSVPSLRTRIEDIPELSEHLLTILSKNNGLEKPSLSTSALKTLKNYNFPGNVRELENILERALALYEGSTIHAEDLNLPLNNNALSFDEDYNPSEMSLEAYLEMIEKRLINEALIENKWNKTATAKYLGLSFRSLRYRLKKLDLE
jgi:two-component system response regulator PilR (NtrC family)